MENIEGKVLMEAKTMNERFVIYENHIVFKFC